MFGSLSPMKMPLLAAIVGAAICRVQAQGDTTAATDQPIIFSQPANTPTAAPQPQNGAASPTMPVAPQFFNSHLPTPSLQQNYQPPQPVPQEKDKNIWTLMTPAEILGVEPPEKALRSAQQKAYDEEREGNTPLERFMKRQADAQAIIATNGAAGKTFTAQWDFSRNDDKSRLPGESESDFSSRQRQNTADFLKNSLDEWSAHPAKDNGHNLSLSQKFQSKTENAQQMMTLQQFSQLLAPGQNPEDAPKISSALSPSKINDSKVPIVDPDLQPQPLFNPVGASYKPLQSNISRPTGIQPLPTLTSPVVPSVAAPAWALKAPPWHSTAPQPFAIPQRQF